MAQIDTVSLLLLLGIAVYIQIVTEASTPAPTTDMACYVCSNKYIQFCDNIKYIKTCPEHKQFCLSSYSWRGRRTTIMKRCVPRCPRPNINWHSPKYRIDRYCCNTTMCNQPRLLPPPPEETTAV